MRLRDYLNEMRYGEKKLTIKKFAESIELSPMHITNYLHKRTPVSKKVARAIERITEGKVTADEVMKENPPKKSPIPKNII